MIFANFWHSQLTVLAGFLDRRIGLNPDFGWAAYLRA